MNGSMHNYKAKIGAESGRFAMVIEADRTAIQGSHFLLDTATGDVWRTDSADGRTGNWLPLGVGPEDVRELEEEPADDA